MMTPDTSVDQTAELGYDPETEEDWFEEPEELPRRRRRRLFGPLPLALFAVLLLAGGFLAGVLVEKGQSSSSSASATGGSVAGLAARFKALRSAAGTTGAGAGATAGGEAGGARSAFGGRATSGQVSFIEGSTIYVTDSEGNTVRVNASKDPEVSKTVKTDVKSIHPGETVLITGSTATDGTVTAESIRVGSTGLGGGLGALFGGGAGAGAGSGANGGSGSGGSGGSKSSGGSEPSLFGNG